VLAGAVVIATGGCAFLSKALGCNVLTGDGGLMAAEAGGEMSGMEFSNAYAIAPVFASVTKTAYYRWASFYYEDGRKIEGAGSQRGRSIIAKTLLTQPVYAQLDQIAKDDTELKAYLRAGQPNFFVPFDRAGIDPFNDRFQVTLRLEGTVRGTGGIRIADTSCATTVPGLYAAGDAATRELICGGFTGGGSHNAAWAMSSGFWAGEAAAGYARKLGRSLHDRRVTPVGRAALRPSRESAKPFDHADVIRGVQDEVHPYDKNLFRTQAGLSRSLERLNDLWQEVQTEAPPDARAAIRAREAAAMVATARWMYATARERTETRGMHKHVEYPQQDPAQHRRLLSGGLDVVWVKPDRTPPLLHREEARAVETREAVAA
jgi:succinate dehydrogenase/fumarate reductase flavoprotein subunit